MEVYEPKAEEEGVYAFCCTRVLARGIHKPVELSYVPALCGVCACDAPSLATMISPDIIDSLPGRATCAWKCLLYRPYAANPNKPTPTTHPIITPAISPPVSPELSDVDGKAAGGATKDGLGLGLGVVTGAGVKKEEPPELPPENPPPELPPASIK